MTQGLSIHSRELDHAQLRLTFDYDQDRYSHRLFVTSSEPSRMEGGDGRSVEGLVLTSLEGRSDQAWPESPPFQQLSIEPIEGRDVALLTGMAGKSHWSASISPDLDRPFLTFDIAAKCNDSPPYLGSQYGIAETDESRDDPLGESRSRSVIVSALDNMECVIEVTRGQITPKISSEHRVCLTPNDNAEPIECAARWIYSIGLRRRS